MAATIDTRMVTTTKITTRAAGFQPSAAICSRVIRMPSNATPMRSTVREVNSMPSLALALTCEKIHRHAEQQREQHHWRAIVLGKKTRRGGNDQADDKTGDQFLHTAVNISQGNGTHRRIPCKR